jgi:subtilisin-like proprotein convertase family protein
MVYRAGVFAASVVVLAGCSGRSVGAGLDETGPDSGAGSTATETSTETSTQTTATSNDSNSSGPYDGAGEGPEPGTDCEATNLELGTDYSIVEVPLSEFFVGTNIGRSFSTTYEYQSFFGQPPPVSISFGDPLIFIHLARRPLGTHYEITKLDLLYGCDVAVNLGITRLADHCENFAHERIGPVSAHLQGQHLWFVQLNSWAMKTFDCERDGAAEFEACSEAHWCAPGLLCAGITRASAGTCLDVGMYGAYASGIINVPIVAGELMQVSFEVGGLGSFDTDVIVSASLNHGDPSALTVSLTSPSGNQAVIWAEEPSPYELLSHPNPGWLVLDRIVEGFDGEETVNGTWTLSITDAGDVGGTLNKWGLEIMSRWE